MLEIIDDDTLCGGGMGEESSPIKGEAKHRRTTSPGVTGRSTRAKRVSADRQEGAEPPMKRCARHGR